MGPSSFLALQINTETEVSFDDGKVDHEQENEDYSAISMGYFPYYRSCEKHIFKPLTCCLNAEGEKPDNDWKDEREGGCAEDGGDVEKVNWGKNPSQRLGSEGMPHPWPALVPPARPGPSWPFPWCWYQCLGKAPLLLHPLGCL